MRYLPTIDTQERRNARNDGRRPRLVGVRRGAGMFYPPQGLAATGTPSQGVLSLAPIDIPVRCVLQALAAEVSTLGSAGAVLRLGVYTDDGTETYPETLVVDAGTIDATVAATTTLTLTTSLILEPGRYWVGGVSQGAPSTAPIIRCVSSSGAITMPNTTNTITAANLGATMAGVTGALPTTYTTSVGYGTAIPRVALKLN